MNLETLNFSIQNVKWINQETNLMWPDMQVENKVNFVFEDQIIKLTEGKKKRNQKCQILPMGKH